MSRIYEKGKLNVKNKKAIEVRKKGQVLQSYIFIHAPPILLPDS